jgi:cell division protein FtsQ
LIALTVAAVALTAGYFAWFRTSSLVAVTEVEVRGLSSPDAPRISDALTKAAGSMSTLSVDDAGLERAVAGFPTVTGVSAEADFPHGLVIEVSERPPVLMARAGGETVPVGPDGVLLRGLDVGDAAKSLPVLELDSLPSGEKLAGDGLAQALVLGAAPDRLRPLIEGVSIEGERGVEVTLSGDVPIRFGTPELAAQKWAAAAAVLADPKTETFTYVDVRVPERPALGGAEAPAVAEAVAEAEPTAEVAPVAVDPAAAAVDPAATTADPAATAPTTAP